jgi:hypothetical protein
VRAQQRAARAVREPFRYVLEFDQRHVLRY